MISTGREGTKTPTDTTEQRYLFVRLGNIIRRAETENWQVRRSEASTLNMSPDSSSWCELCSSCDCLYLCHIFSINGFISLLLSYDKNLSHHQPHGGFCFRSSARLSVYKDTTLTSTAFCQASNITLLVTDWQIFLFSTFYLFIVIASYLATVHHI